eukprot:gene8359-9259_t
MAESSHVQPDDLLVSGLVDNNPLYHKLSPTAHADADNEPGELSAAAYETTPELNLREARVRYFSRPSRRPLRYRHSTGSPTLSDYNGQPSTGTSTEEEAREEIESTEEDAVVNNVHPTEEASAEIESTDKEALGATDEFGQAELERFMRKALLPDDDVIPVPDLKDAKEVYEGRLKEIKHVIVQRDKDRFWGHIAFIKHLVDYLFGHQSALSTVLSVDDAELKFKLDNISKGNKDDLFEMEINPVGTTEECQKLFALSYVLFKNVSSIQKFKDGIFSISPVLAAHKYFQHLKSFFLPRNKHLSLTEFLGLLKFQNTAEKGSNDFSTINNLICDLEAYFAEVGNGNVDGVTLEQLLFLFTSCESIPLFGFDKPIEVFFEKDVLRISTCGLYITLPLEDTIKNLEVAVKFGAGFGSI